MKCVCINNKNDFDNSNVIVIPHNIESPMDENNFVSIGTTSLVGGVERYNITIDCEYDVYGIIFFRDESYFLIQNDDSLLSLYNSKLFKITINELFCEWGIKQYLIENDTFTIISFDFFIEYNNFIRLLENGHNEVRKFFEYKQNMW